MNLSMKKRLDSLEQRIGPGLERVLIYVHETPAEPSTDLINRWKAGEKVEGVRGPAYQASGHEYIFIVFVATQPRKNGEGMECVHNED